LPLESLKRNVVNGSVPVPSSFTPHVTITDHPTVLTSLLLLLSSTDLKQPWPHLRSIPIILYICLLSPSLHFQPS
jgi:hypothetical protein